MGLPRRVAQQGPRLHAKHTRELFQGRDFDALQGLAGEHAIGERRGNVGAFCELVGVLPAPPFHVSFEVVFYHETNTSINAGA